MIQSIFLLSPTGEVLIERHYRENHTPRSICDYYWSIVSEVGAGSPLGHGATFSPTGTVMITEGGDAPSASVPSVGGAALPSSIPKTATPANFLAGAEGPMFDVADVPPVMAVPLTGTSDGDGDGEGDGDGGQGAYVLFNVHRGGLHYLAACPGEVSPLLVVEFLHRVADVFVEYFGAAAPEGSTASTSLAGTLLGDMGMGLGGGTFFSSGYHASPVPGSSVCNDGGVDEYAIKENFSTVYQVLEEMMDRGWPLTTETCVLREMVRPPPRSGPLGRLVAGAAESAKPEARHSPADLPWRKASVRHSQNEIYVDIIEEVDAVLDGSDGRLLSADVSGHIRCQSQLSGLPDLSLAFHDPDVVGDDCSFHPCVRYGRYEHDRVISFVPPDGHFELMRYRVRPEVAPSPPIIVVPQISYGSSEDQQRQNGYAAGTITVHLTARPLSSLLQSSSSSSSKAALLEDVSLAVPFPRSVRTVTDLQVTAGTVRYDEASRVAKWTIGNVNPGGRGRNPAANMTLTGKMVANGPRPTAEHPALQVCWKVPGASISGLTVAGLSVGGVSYKPYKGVRTVTRSGRYFVRCT